MSWPEAKLGDVCEIVSGATPKRNVPEFWANDVPWVTPKDISNQDITILEDAPEYISHAGLKSCAAKMLPKGSILLSSRAPIGHVAIAGREMCTNQGFKNLVPTDSVHNKYLYHVMKASKARLNDKGSGATFKEVSKAVVSEFTIPLPPIEEQRRIAAILDKADQVRKQRQQSLDMLDDFLRATFLDMFGDPVTNPNGWDVKPLSASFSKTRNGAQSGPFGAALKKHEYVDQGIPVWGIDCVKPNRFVENAKLFITENKYADLRRYEVLEGDVLISRAGTVGRMCVARPNAQRSIISTNIVRVALDDTIMLPDFFAALFTYLGHRLEGLKSNQKEGAFTFLNPKKLRSLRTYCPPINHQHDYMEIVSRTDAQRQSYSESLRKSNDLFASLSQRAFKGEL